MSPIKRPVFFILICLWAVSACRSGSPGQANFPDEPVKVVSSQEVASLSPGDPEPDYENLPAETRTGNGFQQHVASGLMVETGNLRFEAEEGGGLTLKLDVCFQMPTNSDWSIYAASLRYAGTEIEEYGGDPIEIVEVAGDGTATVHTFENNQKNVSQRPALENEQSRRCDTVYFWGLPGEIREAGFTFTVDSIYASRDTGGPCTAELLARAQQVIDTLADGIVLACSDDLANGYAGLAIERIPDGMTREAAEAVFYNRAFYLALFGVIGPWEFVFPATADTG